MHYLQMVVKKNKLRVTQKDEILEKISVKERMRRQEKSTNKIVFFG